MARYRIVPGRSRVWIEARSTLHPIHTETDGLEGWLELDVGTGGQVDLAVTPSAHLELAVERLSSGNPLEDRELRRRIEARRYPIIEGDLTLMRGTAAAGRYRVAGDVTLKGVTRRYEDEMTVEAMDGMVVLAGERTFDVRDFGVEPPRILMLRVHPDVTVKIAIVAEKEACDVHELGLCASIVDAVGQRAGERPVARVRIRVGRLHHVHPDAFDQSFAVAAMGSVAEGAEAELVLVPVAVRCGSCGEVTEADELPQACGGCGGVDLEIAGGDELILESIEYRAPLGAER